MAAFDAGHRATSGDGPELSFTYIAPGGGKGKRFGATRLRQTYQSVRFAASSNNDNQVSVIPIADGIGDYSDRLDKPGQCGTIGLRHVAECFARRFGFAAVP